MSNRFVDRDMFMRFRGGGVGHKATNSFTTAFCQDAQENTRPANEDIQVQFAGDEDDEEARLMVEEDYGYYIGNNGDEDEEDLEETVNSMGAEDGEEPWEMDDLEAEGYGEL